MTLARSQRCAFTCSRPCRGFLPPRTSVQPIRCQAKTNKPEQSKNRSDSVLRNPPALRGATLLLAAALSAHAQPAVAAGRGLAWEPRRHHRRLPREAEYEAPGKQVKVEAEKQQPAPEPEETPADLASQIAAAQRSLESAASTALDKVQSGYESASSRLRSVTSRQQEYGILEPVRSPHDWNMPVSRETLGLGASIIGGALVLWLLFSKVLRQLFDSSRKVPGGKWVRDRSLGGKEVFIADEPARAASPAAPRGAQQQRPPETAAAYAGPSVAMPEAGTRVVTVRSRREQAANAAPPEWWVEQRPPVYVHPTAKAEAETAAKQLMKELENSKLQGIAYPISAIVELHQTCMGAGITAKASTERGRDAIFRTAVNSALAVALESNRLGGNRPQQFVCGFAKDLGITMARAVQIVHAEVASKVRTMIINACAARRANNVSEEMNQLLRLSALLTQFPLPRGSAEGEVIASSIAARCWLSERQHAFLTYGAMEPGTAPLMAELLGFDPALVLPQLAEYTRDN